MGAKLSNDKLEWATNKEMKHMDEKLTQWVIICVIGPDSGPVDGVIEDVTDLHSFQGMTADDDLFDIAYLKPLIYEGMTGLSTGLSLKRECTWASVRTHMHG